MSNSKLSPTVLDFRSIGSTTAIKMTASGSDMLFDGVGDVDCTLSGVANPTTAQQAATKSYVDSLVVVGVTWKNACRLATDGNEDQTFVYDGTSVITVSGGTGDEIDGVAVVDGDRILMKNMATLTTTGSTTPLQGNGIYVVSAAVLDTSFTLTRTADATNGDVANGSATFVYNGDTTPPLNNDSTWVVTTDAVTTWGGTPVVIFGQMTAPAVLGSLSQNEMFVGDTNGDPAQGGANMTYNFSSRATAPVFGIGVDTTVVNTDATFNLGTGTSATNVNANLNMGAGAGTTTLATGANGVVSLFGTTAGAISLGSTSTGALTINSGTSITMGDASAGVVTINGTSIDVGSAATGTVVVDSNGGAVSLGNTTTGTVSVGSAVAAAVSVSGGSSGVTVGATGGDVTISTTTSGKVIVDSAASSTAVSVTSGTNLEVSAQTVTVTASSADIAVNAFSAPTVDATGFTVDDASTVYIAGAPINGGGTITRSSHLAMGGSTSGSFGMTVPAAVTDYSVTWPAAVAGGSSYSLVSDGSGIMSWAAPGAATMLALPDQQVYVGTLGNIAEPGTANFLYDREVASTSVTIGGIATAVTTLTLGTSTFGATIAGAGTGLVSLTSGGPMTQTAAAASNVSLYETTTSGTITVGNATAGTGTISIDGNSSQIDVGPTTTGAINVGHTLAGAVTLNSGSTIGIGDTTAGAITMDSSAAITVGTTSTSTNVLSAGAVAVTATTTVGVTAGSNNDITLTTSGTGRVSIPAGENSTSTTTGALVITGGLGVSQDAYALTWNTMSDVNYKTNITPLIDPLETLKRIEGYSYDWKSEIENNGKRQIGVIAQQLEDCGLGNLVTDGSHKAVNYLGLIPILIEAVKELSAKVDFQEKR